MNSTKAEGESKSPGRINFENVLEKDLHRANELYRNGQFTKFMLTTQQIWANCLRADRDAILNYVESLQEEEGKRTGGLSMKR